MIVIHTDGGARGNPGPAACGVVVLAADGSVHWSQGKFLGQTTNNQAEYAGFRLSLDWVEQHLAELTSEQVIWKLDSKLVVEQLLGHWKVKEPELQPIVKNLKDRLATLSLEYQITHVPRAENALADAVVNQVLDQQLSSSA